jgi:hypothetical protein
MGAAHPVQTRGLKIMRGILIDPSSESVKVVDVDKESSYESILEHLKVRMIESVQVSNRDVMYVDEEGLLHVEADSRFWVLVNSDGKPVGFYNGCGLILGDDGEGGDTDTRLAVSAVESVVKWISKDKLEECLDIVDNLVDNCGVAFSEEEMRKFADRQQAIFNSALVLTK